MSVWQGIDRRRFEADLDLLYRRGRFQQQKGLPPLSASAQRRDSVLDSNTGPLVFDDTTEFQLANDFAVLASASNWPGDVAAAAFQLKSNQGTLCVSIAANSGVSQRVKTLVRGVLRILELRAKRELKRPAAIEYILDEIVRVHKDQVLGRMGSPKAQGQKKREADVSGRFKALLDDLEQRAHSRGSSNEVASLIVQLQTLQSLLKAAESAEPGSSEEHSSIKHFIYTCAELTTGAEPFIARLRRAGLDNINKDSRVVREIQAIGNYRRIASYAVEAAKRYQRWFQSIDLNVIRVDPSLGSYSRERFYVHAEIQLVLYFERETVTQPRYIGASKKPCFLCYCFIRAFRTPTGYGIGRSHGEVFRHWTVPEDPALGDEARKRLNVALRQTAEDIRQAPRLAQSPKANKWLFHPLQSVSKLLLDLPRNSSNSTIVSVVTVTKSSASAAARSLHVKPALEEPLSVTGVSKKGEMDRHSFEVKNQLVSIASASKSQLEKESEDPEPSGEDASAHEDSSSARAREASELDRDSTAEVIDQRSNDPERDWSPPTPALSAAVVEEQLEIFKRTVTANVPLTYCDNRLELFFEMEHATRIGADASTASANGRAGLCRVRTLSRSQCVDLEVVDIARLQRNLLTLETDEKSGLVRFVLRLEHQDYAIELRWI